jgi:hypothetical protein
VIQFIPKPYKVVVRGATGYAENPMLSLEFDDLETAQAEFARRSGDRNASVVLMAWTPRVQIWSMLDITQPHKDRS